MPKKQENHFKSKSGKTVIYDDDYFGVAVLKLYGIPYSNENKLLYDSKLIKTQEVYNHNPNTNIDAEINKFIDEN